MVVIEKSGCIRAMWLYSSKVDVFGQKWLYSGKSGCVRAKVVVFVQSACIRAKWLYSGKVFVFRQGGCIWAKVVVFGEKQLSSAKRGCI